MKKYMTGIVGVAALGLVSCTSLSEGQDGVPGADQNRRVRLRTDANLREQMDEQSSDINRKKNIEGRRNDPATKPPEVRPERLPNSPTDTTRHNKQPPPPKRD